jgi:hypothetical protein
LAAILFALGLFAIRKFVSEMVPRWIDSISGLGFQFVSIVASYSNYFEPNLQLDLQKCLVDRCEKRRFDAKLFEITAIVMLCSSPTLSPFFDRFLDSVARSVNPPAVLNMVRPLLEPRSQPIVHPLRNVMQIREAEKRDAFAQANPAVKSVALQCDRSREIRPVTVPALIAPRPAMPERKREVHLPVIDLDADDLGLDIDAPPDSDESD